jgi:hypothetical protein
MLHNPVVEARNWKVTGQINQARAQWVAANLRPMRKARRAQLLDAIAEVRWDTGAADPQ